ncbi:restriction endonuclease [Streptomyces sp. NPDC019826]|uniref:restriction endonuclease n=1 Tax=Streptomyces sp. NPDC019826 TaxID=3156667 RepID=UPI0033DA5DD9
MSTVRGRDKSLGKEFWRKFEEEVERAVAQLGNATVRRDVQVPGALSGRPRQIDVLAVGDVAGCSMTVVFEAKCYSGRVQIGTIDELVGKSLDVAAQSAVLYAPNGFSEGARARAAGTQNSPLRVGIGELEVDWPSTQPAPESDVVLGSEMPMRIIPSQSHESMWSSVMSSYPSVPATTDDYGSFFRGEVPLFIDR